MFPLSICCTLATAVCGLSSVPPIPFVPAFKINLESFGTKIGFDFFPSVMYSNDHDVGWCIYLHDEFDRFGIRCVLSVLFGAQGWANESNDIMFF